MQKPTRGTKPKPTSTPLSDKVDTRTKKQLICSLVKKKTKQKFLSESQRKYYDILNNNQITICSGPAGVGKSYICLLYTSDAADE